MKEASSSANKLKLVHTHPRMWIGRVTVVYREVRRVKGKKDIDLARRSWSNWNIS